MQDSAPSSTAVAWTFADFVKTMIAEGRAVVSREPLKASGTDAEAECLLQWHTLAAEELTGPAPAFSIEAAAWAATMLCNLARFVACRDIGEADIRTACQLPCPAKRLAASDFSVDLAFRHLPALYKLARHLSNADPLLDELKRLASAWPLSSVGMPDLKPITVESFVDDPALLALYVDRIIAENDLSRLGDPRVDEAIRTAIAGHHELAPKLAQKLFIPLASTGAQFTADATMQPCNDATI